MYCTYVVRPGEAPEGRQPQFAPFWEVCMDWNLRLGLALKVVSWLLFVVAGILNCGFGSWGFIFFASVTERINRTIPGLMAMVAAGTSVAAALTLQGFRNSADDEAGIKYARGYRGGFKALNYATLLDLVASAMTGLRFFAMMVYFEDKWTTQTAGIYSMEIYGLVAQMLNLMALILYGVAFFSLENYHPEGTAECWGWSMLSMFKISAVTGGITLLTGWKATDMVYALFLGASYLVALSWAVTFEQVVAEREVGLSQSAIRNEHYKSSNAMAYYGPPVETGAEFVAVR